MRPDQPEGPAPGDPLQGRPAKIFAAGPEAPHADERPGPAPSRRGARRGVPRWAKWTAGVLVGLVILGALIGDPESKRDDAVVGQTNASESKQAPEEPRVEIDIANPDDSDTIRRNVAVVEGTVNPPDADVEVDGGPPRELGGGRWQKRVRLELGEQEIEVRASAPDHRANSDTLTLTRRRSAAELKRLRALRAERRAREKVRREAERAAREQNFRASVKTIPYNQLEKNPDNYVGTKVAYTGQIFQIQEDGAGGWMLLSVTDEGYGLWTDNIYVEYEGSIAAAEDDVITVLGTVQGQYSYETQIGGETFVPHVQARYIDE
jgi:hypothetical protein